MMFQTLVLLILLFANQAWSAQVTETFSSGTQRESSNLVWNFALKSLHPTLQVVDWNNGGGNKTSDFDVGDGSHGSFELSTYSQFSTNGDLSGQIIRLDTARFPILKVSKFVLERGWTLLPTGTSPLVIYSLSDVIVSGTIQCSGQTGVEGGTGRCGGAQGGSGGTITGSGSQGGSVTASVGGGFPGTFGGVTFGAGGGGGGAFSNVQPVAGVSAGGSTAGSYGLYAPNNDFSVIGGGAGGGGGSGSGSANNEVGGRGGGGGGVIIIHAVGHLTMTKEGRILAQGGVGANTSTSGAGGGGGGGSIQILIAGDFTVDGTETPYTISAEGGTHGTASGGGGNGGNGTYGRTWLANSGTYNSIASGSEFPGCGMTTGTVKYAVQTQSAVSKSYDLQSTLPLMESISATPTSNSVTIDLAGSDDAFVSDDTGWQPSSDLAKLNNKRYFKFRVNINNTNAVTPVKVTQVALNFSVQNKKDFNMVSSCAMVKNQKPPGPLVVLIFLLPFFFLVQFRSKRINPQE